MIRSRPSPAISRRCRPTAESQRRNCPDQSLLASIVPAGWKATPIPTLYWPSSVARRVPRRRIPEVDFGASRLPRAWCHRGSRRSSSVPSAARMVRIAGPSSRPESGTPGGSTHCQSWRSGLPSGRKANVRIVRASAGRIDRLANRNQELRIAAHDDSAAVRAESNAAADRAWKPRTRRGARPRPIRSSRLRDCTPPGSGRRG